MQTIDLQVVSVTGNEHKLQKNSNVIYRELIVKFGITEITAYFTTDINVEEGALLRVSKWQITNCWRDFCKCALMLYKFQLIDELDFEPVDAIPLTFKGILLKSNNKIKVVSITQKQVFSSAVRLDNGRGKLFSVLIVGFDDRAESLYALDNHSEVVVSGTLHLAKVTNDYEIHLTKIKKGE